MWGARQVATAVLIVHLYDRQQGGGGGAGRIPSGHSGVVTGIQRGQHAAGVSSTPECVLYNKYSGIICKISYRSRELSSTTYCIPTVSVHCPSYIGTGWSVGQVERVLHINDPLPAGWRVIKYMHSTEQGRYIRNRKKSLGERIEIGWWIMHMHST